jgi:hypothetical protein
MKEYQSKFRKKRAEDAGSESESAPSAPKAESKPKAEPGPRAQANDLNAKPSEGQDEQLESQTAPDMGMGGAQAREIHITHDHAAGRHHVHTVNDDGTEMHSDHATPEEAHMAGAAAGGVNPDGNYPEKHKHPHGQANPESTMGDEDDFQPNID